MNQSTVNLTLRADTSSFSASIRQAEQEFTSRFKQMGSTAGAQSTRIEGNFNSMASGVGRFSSAIKRAAAQLTIMAGTVTGIGLLGKRFLDVADNTANAADRIGITTGLLQELRFAATQTGVSTDKLEISLERFVRRMGDAANGTGAAATTYQRLGISVLEADGSIRDSGAVLNDVADALQGLGSQAERAAATTALFGRTGVAMSIMLGRGAKGIEEYKQQAQKLGIVIDEELLRNAEKAGDKLDIMFSVLKAQAVSAFVQLTPHIIDFSQRIVAAIPKIKEFLAPLAQMKDAFLLLAKVLTVSKLVNFTTGLMKASKSFLVAGSAAAKFTQAMTLVSRTLKGLGISLAVITTIEALSLLKQHLDLKKEAKSFIQAQQSLMEGSQQFANITRLSVDDFKQLAKAEQQDYRDRLKAASEFWQAKLSLESRQDFQSSSAMAAAKENRLFKENLSMVEDVFTKRTELERQHAATLHKIRTDETTKLKHNISEQLKAYDKANEQLHSLKEKRKTIAKEFQGLIDEIKSPNQKAPEDLTVLDVTAAQQSAKQSLKQGDIEKALQTVNQAKEIIRSLSQTEGASKAYLTEQAKATAEIADQVVQAEIQAQEKNIVSIKDKITEIKAQAELLKHLTVEFDVNGAIKSADEMRSILQERLANNPIIIPTITIPESKGIDARAEQILKPQKKARGGFILGPGTSMSDSILARLSRGEFVLRASAVKHYGLGVLNKLNQKELPRFAQGGLVPPYVPGISSPSASNHKAASLTLNLGSETFAVRTQDFDVVQALTKAVAREALKSGRRT